MIRTASEQDKGAAHVVRSEAVPHEGDICVEADTVQGPPVKQPQLSIWPPTRTNFTHPGELPAEMSPLLAFEPSVGQPPEYPPQWLHP